jgi:phage baseplate assembly protein V
VSDALHQQFAALAREVADLKRRVDNAGRHGVVSDVDAEKQVVRLKIGGTESEPFKSPWVPYAQIAGAMKIHTPPSVGQQMTLLVPTGDFRQALALPMTWSNQNKSPSTKKDEHVLTFGKIKIVAKADNLKISVGDSSVEITENKIVSKSAKIKDVGKSYLGLPSEDAQTKQVVIQGDESSKRVLAPTSETDPEIDEAAPPPAPTS